MNEIIWTVNTRRARNVVATAALGILILGALVLALTAAGCATGPRIKAQAQGEVRVKVEACYDSAGPCDVKEVAKSFEISTGGDPLPAVEAAVAEAVSEAAAEAHP